MIEIPLAELGLVTAAEAAAMHSVSPEAVQGWVRGDLLPAVVVGTGERRIYLLRLSDVSSITRRPKGRPKGRPKVRSKPRAERAKRDAEIVADRLAGLTLAAIGAKHGLTKERVRQISSAPSDHPRTV